MAYDFRANQVRLNRIISSGSIPIYIYPSSSAADFAGNLVPSFDTSAIGSDVFLFVSGSSTAKTLFGGDVKTSGSFRSLSGITGSIKFVDDAGLSFISASATSDITTVYNSSGQWVIGAPKYFTSPSNKVLLSTGSLQVVQGITGSISGTYAGDPFLVAGPNVTVNYNTLGQWAITSSAAGTNIWAELDSTHISTTSSAAMAHLSASLGAEITGSVVLGEAGKVFATGVGAFAHGASDGGGGSVQALGAYSHAEGCKTVVDAGASFAHAEGLGTNAKAANSHTEGNQTEATGPSSHTEGYQTKTNAFGEYAHAEGYQTHANAKAAHAEGNNTTASGDYSHSEGINTTASNLYAHAEGRETTASNEASHAEGKSTHATNKYAHAEGEDTTAAGQGSHAGGHGTEAHADYQTAIGTYNVPSNNTSLFVVGDGNNITPHDVLRVEPGNVQVTGSLISPQITGSLSGTVSGYPFIVAGPNITASYNSLGQWEITGSAGGGGGGGTNYWASNVNNVIYTTGSAYATTLSASAGIIITGSFIQANPGGTSSANPTAGFAQGYNVTATNLYSHAEGETTTAGGIGCHAEGDNTNAGGRDSHAEGSFTTTNGQYCHAEGFHTNAGTWYKDGQGSHAEGDHTTTIGSYSHAEGSNTKTYGESSHAEGYFSIAVGQYSHAGGYCTIASGSNGQTTYGKYNKRNNTTSLFVVGDGTGDSDTLRHDVLRVESGSVQVTGSLISPQITGSIQYVSNTTPFIVGSNGVVVNYNGAGQYELTGSGSGGGSVISSSLTVTGDSVNQGSGSIGGLFTLSAGQVGKYNVQVVAIDSAGTNSATWDFSVSGFYPTTGSFTFLGINELTFEHTPSAATWDVNFNSSGQIEVTGSTAVSGTFFYTQIFAKMIGRFGTVVF